MPPELRPARRAALQALLPAWRLPVRLRGVFPPAPARRAVLRQRYPAAEPPLRQEDARAQRLRREPSTPLTQTCPQGPRGPWPRPDGPEDGRQWPVGPAAQPRWAALSGAAARSCAALQEPALLPAAQEAAQQLCAHCRLTPALRPALRPAVAAAAFRLLLPSSAPARP